MSDGLRFETDADILRRRNYELTILNAIAQALNSSVDLDQALHAALAQVAELLDLRTGWIWLLHEDTGESYLAAALNLPPALADSPRRMEGTCYCLDTYRAGDLEGAANVNVVTCSRLWGLIDGTEGLRYHASIPLYAHEKQLGVLNVASADWRGLSPEDLRLLHTVGDMLSIAIERARLFARSVQLGAAEERNRLAREIHDTLAQGLSAIALHLETADALLETEANLETEADLEKVREAVHRALALTRANLEEARRSVLDLRAAPLEGRSLTEALAELSKDWEVNSEWQVEYEVVGGHRPLPSRVEVGLYRIAQEALTNIAQHADARRVTLSLVMTPAQVRLRVEDDGRGFELPQVPTGRYGLIGLNERAKLLGGTLELESSPGVGTRVEVLVPMRGAEMKG
jgi:two-component system NarL family sensor kinase